MSFIFYTHLCNQIELVFSPSYRKDKKIWQPFFFFFCTVVVIGARKSTPFKGLTSQDCYFMSLFISQKHLPISVVSGTWQAGFLTSFKMANFEAVLFWKWIHPVNVNLGPNAKSLKLQWVRNRVLHRVLKKSYYHIFSTIGLIKKILFFGMS